jgi:hypothetical protein
MARPNPQRVAAALRLKTAGEVRFIKDRSGEKGEWGWGAPGPNERTIQEDFVFNPRYLKPLALVLRSSLMALGHATSAHARFVKIKSRNVSPDGALGGKGYIAKIPDMRRQIMNVVEALSAMTDTVYDEINAPHWDPAEDIMDARDRQEVLNIVDEAEDIREDPEGWAREEEEEEDDESGKKKASAHRVRRRFAESRPPVDARQAAEFRARLNEIDHLVIQLRSQSGQIGYWGENARGDLRTGALTIEALDTLTDDAARLSKALLRPLGDLKKIHGEYSGRPRYASSRAAMMIAAHQVKSALQELSETLPQVKAACAGDMSTEVVDFVGDLRSVQSHLQQVVENSHV